MSRSDHRTLVNWGRKAGLRTSELYQAMAARPPEGNERTIGLADTNGYVSAYDHRGQRCYHPVGSGRRV